MTEQREIGWDVPEYDTSGAPWPEYYAALGRFVQMYGSAEERLHSVLKGIIFDLTSTEGTKFNLEIIGAITGSMRFAGLRDHFKRIFRVSNYDQPYVVEFDYVLNQLGDIHSFRDRIVHHGAAAFSATEFVTSNVETVREGDQEELIIFTPEILLDMASDLRAARVFLAELNDIFLTMETSGPTWDRWITSVRPKWRFKSSNLRREGPKHWTKPPMRSKKPKRSDEP